MEDFGSKQEVELQNYFEVSKTEHQETGIRFFKLTDSRTGIEVSTAEFNPDFDVHAFLAWEGARASRAKEGEGFLDIAKQIASAIRETETFAGDKLENIYVNYGHASVADMAPVMLFIDKAPMHIPFSLFNRAHRISGQERSTRYVRFEDAGVQLVNIFPERELNTETQEIWDRIFEKSSELYDQWDEVLYENISSYIDQGVSLQLESMSDQEKELFLKKNESSKRTRTLDVARQWLPFGASTMVTGIMSARDWNMASQQFEEHGDPMLAEQIAATLRLHGVEGVDIKANIGGLLKYSESDDTIQDTLRQVADYARNNTNLQYLFDADNGIDKLNVDRSKARQIETTEFKYESGMLLFQYLAVVRPGIDIDEAILSINKLNDDELSELGGIIFAGHDHHNLMGNIGDNRGITFSADTALSVQRDLNRHRAFGRLSVISENPVGALDDGFNLNYQLGESSYWSHLTDQWISDAQDYYELLRDLERNLLLQVDEVQAAHIIKNALPLGHQTRSIYSAPITQWNYMTSLRVGMGGDFSYRSLIYEMLEDLRDCDPLLSSINDHLEKPDPNNINQLLGRS